jgi:hypothetical protein
MYSQYQLNPSFQLGVLQSVILIVTGNNTSDKFKPTRVGIGSYLTARLKSDFILGALV